VKLDEKAIKWIIREKEGNSNQNNSKNRKYNTEESKSNLQAIQRYRRDTKTKEAR